MIPKERDKRPPTPIEGINGHANGHSLSRIAPTADGATLAFAGELDISSAEEFSDGMRALTTDDKGEVVLSLEGCGFIDSSGLRALIMLAQELRTRDQRLVLTGLQDGPRRVFEITGLLDGRDFEVRDAAGRSAG